MDDGYSPVGILLLIGFILLEAAFYGFGAAVQNMDEDELEESAGKGDASAARLLKVMEGPGRLIHMIQLTTHLVGILIGAVLLPVLAGRTSHLVRSFFPAAGTAAWYADPVWWLSLIHI